MRAAATVARRVCAAETAGSWGYRRGRHLHDLDTPAGKQTVSRRVQLRPEARDATDEQVTVVRCLHSS